MPNNNSSTDDVCMQELASDPEYISWCEKYEEETQEHMSNLSDEEFERIYKPQDSYVVFVYGSLKRGFGNHRFLEGTEFLGAASTSNYVYRMHSLGPFPAVVENGDYAVSGELYKVDGVTMERLDMLEGNGSLYTRKLVSVRTTENEVVDAWIYLYLMPETSAGSVLASRNVVDRFVCTDGNRALQEWLQE